MALFEIHPQLLTDCHRLGRLDFCHVLLHKNAAIPWFILVPESDIGDLLDLPADQSDGALHEAALISRFIKRELGYPKINFAAIGNIVPQLHLHVVGRMPGDDCWPAPVWGQLKEGPSYSSSRIAELTSLLTRGYSLRIT